MNERDELLTRLTAAYADKAALSAEVIDLALQAQSCDYPVVAINGSTGTMAIGSFVSLMDYSARLANYFVEYGLAPVIKPLSKLTSQSDIADFNRKDVYIGEYTFKEGDNVAAIAADMQQLFWSSSAHILSA